MNRAVFFDRDGVLISNAHHYYIFREEDMEYVDGVFENLKRIQDKGYLLFVVSNQGGISRGLYSKADVDRVHARMKQDFAMHGIQITDILYCPHHDSVEACLCRKPSPLMLEKLIARYRIDRTQSFFAGDSESDMQAAARAGVKGLLVPANQSMACVTDQIQDVCTF